MREELVPTNPTAKCPYCHVAISLHLDRWGTVHETGRRCQHHVEPERIDGQLFILFREGP